MGPGRVAIEPVRIDQLRRNPANPRRITAQGLESLCGSSGSFGVVEAVVARGHIEVVVD